MRQIYLQIPYGGRRSGFVSAGKSSSLMMVDVVVIDLVWAHTTMKLERELNDDGYGMDALAVLGQEIIHVTKSVLQAGPPFELIVDRLVPSERALAHLAFT
jgi:hypothetical protein